MSVVDYLINSLIKKLQKTQKVRKAKRAVKKRKAKRRTATRKRTAAPRPAKRPARKPVKKRSKKPVKKPVKKLAKKPVRKSAKTAAKKPVKKSAQKPVKGKEAKPAAVVKEAVTGPCIGEVTHFFSRIQVVVLKMNAGSVSVGDTIRIKGKGADFTQKVASLQIESVDVKVARKGQLVGLKVKKVAKVGSKVYKEQ